MKVVQQIGRVAAVAAVAGCMAAPASVESPAPAESGVDPTEAPADDRAPLVIGAILPRTGPAYLTRYGDPLLEGIELAREAATRSAGREVVVDVIDDGGDPERAAAAVREFERRGVSAIIGPITAVGFPVAARARSDLELPMLGPLAFEPSPAPNVYALNAPDTRGAEALARYAVAAGLDRVALLYPRLPEYRRQANAFITELVRRGGRMVAEVPYDTGTTTFATHIRSIAAADPEAIFVPTSERDVHQVAPQITYYGLAGAGVQILGGESWTTESVRRQVAARYLDGVVATTPLPHGNPEVGWSDFVARYEARYRRSMEGALPALGHDALLLIVAAVEDVAADPTATSSAAAVASGLTRLAGVRGATGVLSMVGGQVVRKPFLVRIQAGELLPVRTPANGASAPAPDAGWRSR